MTDEERKLLRVLGMCQRMEREFTLSEIVARVLRETPDMVSEFAEAWGKLIQRKMVRVARNGRPSIYKVIASHH